MAIGVAVLVLLLGVTIAYQLSVGKSHKRQKVVWGVTFMVVIAPFFSWLVGITYGISVGSGFAAGGLMVILFPVIFLGGLITLLMGIFAKEKGMIEK